MIRNNGCRRQPLSLNVRVICFVALAFGLSLLMIGYLVQSAVERHFAEQDAVELTVITRAVESALQQSVTDARPVSEVLRQAVSGHHGVFFQVWDASGQLLYGDKALTPLPGPDDLVPVDVILPENQYRWLLGQYALNGSVIDARVNGDRYRIIAAIDSGFHLSFMGHFQHSLWSIMALAGVLTLLAAFYGVYQGLAPLRQLSQVIHDVGAEHLHLRLESESFPSELQGLAVSFNRMIASLEDSFTRLSRFSDDIAHELRTPLTNLITQTQVALGKSRSLDEYRELHYSNLEELEHLAKMVNDMLWLAKREQGMDKPRLEAIELASEVNALFEFFEAVADEKQVRLQLTGKAPEIQAERAMLRRALSNLLSNAIRYTPPGEAVTVELSADDKWVSVSVANPGEAIDPEYLPRLFDRFFRADPARQRSDGTGLGLAIVKSIVDAHHGHISATSDSRQTRFTLTLPIGG
ncbi:heavy metal sensor histidine kinase [Shewanella sp. GXUN23E]|uniref:heavy metal sensor histidine kinase n=1 Tax=Shewanella sp. GXUN23E TaxID=3422498 RepID=UPI003D7C3B6E